MTKPSFESVGAVATKVRRAAGRALTKGRVIAVGTLGPRETRLSVVVPCYKVEDYLDATLASIQGQSYKNLEIIVVDDGSPDRSGEIARHRARRDRRIKVISQANAGLGAARNTGIRAAKGEFITFADSDDTIPQGSYAAMMKSLAKTGSDFVVGSVQRRFGSNTWMPLWAQQVHAEDRLGITLSDLPTVLQDVFAWNKVFRRDFFLKHVHEFPEGIRYEDQAPTARAYTSAKAFDVLNKVVYTWMIRDDGSSITQGKTNIKDLQDRLAVKRSVAKILAEKGPKHVYEYWLAKAIGFDLESYFVQIPRTDENYWMTLRDGVRRLAKRLDETSWDQVKFNDRVKVACAMYGTSADVSAVVTTLEETIDGFELVPEDGAVRMDADYVSHLSFELPSDIVRARPIDFEPRARLLSCDWAGPGILVLESQVMYMGLGGTEDDGGLVVEVVDQSGEVVASAQGRRTSIDNPNEIGADAYADHSHDVFTVSLDLNALANEPRMVTGVDDLWRIKVHRFTAAGDFTTYITRRSLLSSAGAFPHGELIGGERLALRWDVGLGLSVVRPQAHAVANEIHVEGRRLALHVDFASSPHAGKPVRELSVSHKWSGTKVRVAPQELADGTVSFSVELPELGQKYRKGAQKWRVRIRYQDGSSELLQFNGGGPSLYRYAAQGARLAPGLTRNGFLELTDRVLGGSVSSVSVADDGRGLNVTGHIDADPATDRVEVALVSQRGTILKASSVSIEGSSMTAVVPLTSPSGRLTAPGGYSLRARTMDLVAGQEQYGEWLWLPVSPELTQELPTYPHGADCDLRLSRTEKARSLWVNVYPRLGDMERGRFAGRSLERQLDSASVRPQDSILFESYGGKTCTDSPAAIAAELRRRGDSRTQYFGISDGSVRAPEGTVPVVVGSDRYRELLRSCRWLVNNNNFPYYFRKQEGQTYIQTWHGTPLKRIGNDVPGANLSLSYRALMQREAAYWDVLLSQNEYSTGIFPSAFDYHGPIETMGYPRNDSLFGDDAQRHRVLIREALGVPEGVTAILYAPTWRDNRKTSGGGYKMVSYLDIDELEKSLGDRFVVLQRGHSNTASSVKIQNDSRVIDVTSHPDLNGLFLASDVLVTDYSSVFFDYSNTRKPIVFLVPDLEDYSGSTRGFYIDLAEIAPGPLCSDTGEVATWLSHESRLRSEWQERYEAFSARFTASDGPGAAATVIDRLL